MPSSEKQPLPSSSGAPPRGWRVGWIERLFLCSLGILGVLQLSSDFGRAKIAAVVAVVLFGLLALWRLALAALRQAIWHIRDRLIVSYVFIAVVPILLLAIFAETGAWVLSSQIGAYLLKAEMDRRVGSLQNTAGALARAPVTARAEAIRRSGFIFRERFPGLEILVRDPRGSEVRYPEDATIEAPPSGFGDRAGVVVKDGHFYLWAHSGGPRSEVIVLAPITRAFLLGLVPNLGDVYLTSFMQTGRAESERVRLHGPVPGEPPSTGPSIPPAANFLDLTILYGLPMPISIWDDPAAEESALLGMRTRISGVLNLLFNQQQWREQTSLLELLVLLAIIFILVELLAAFVGISMTRTITGAMHNLYEGTLRVREGDLSHRIEVKGHDQLAELGRSFNAMAENLERLLRSEKERQRLQAELEIAREVQAQLHPREAPALGSLRLASVCNAARMVSGDYYDYQAVSDRHLAIAIGDVAGKGISAALLMATLQSAMRSQLRHCMDAATANGGGLPEVSTAQLVANLNQHLYTSTAPEKYATFFFSLYDDETGRLSYTNAGHLAPLLIRSGTARPLDVNGTVVGAFPNVPYDESHILLEPGDLLVCYTDGITEPENEYGEMYGEERLISLLCEHGGREPTEVASAVVDAVRRWTSSSELQDDITLVVAKKL